MVDIDMQYLVEAVFSQEAYDNGMVGMLLKLIDDGEISWLPRDIFLATILYCHHWYGQNFGPNEKETEWDTALRTWCNNWQQMMAYGRKWRDEHEEEDDE